MITQSFKSGESEIKVEYAESLQDAKANKFPDGVFSRFYLNGKPVNNYMALIRYIIDETKRTGHRFTPPTPEELKKTQEDFLRKQNEEVKRQLEDMKAQYQGMGVPDEVIRQLDESIKKLDVAGVRVER